MIKQIVEKQIIKEIIRKERICDICGKFIKSLTRNEYYQLENETKVEELKNSLAIYGYEVKKRRMR